MLDRIVAETFRPAIAHRGRKSFSTIGWGQHYLPHYFKYKPSMMHLWLGAAIDKYFDKRGKKIDVVGPRGGAKSTTGTLATPLKRTCEGKEDYILITSDTTRQAVDHLSAIKEELESNEKIEQDYPEAFGVGPIWQANKIVTRNGVTIRAAGTLSRIRGVRKKQARPSLVIMDDPENDEHITSTTMRDRTKTWFERTLMHMGNRQTNYLALGTAIHRECTVLRLQRTPGWITYREDGRPQPFRAIRDWPTRMDLWDKWEQIYYNVDDPEHLKKARAYFKQFKKAMNEGVSLLWPDYEPLYMLMKLRAEIGHQAFEGEKQGNPINPETTEWPDDYFQDMWFDEWPKETVVRVVALDPSKGKNAKRGDYSAFAKLAVAPNGMHYFDINMERRSTDAIVTDGVSVCRKFKAQKLSVEANAFQELLEEEIRFTFEKEGLNIPIEGIENNVHKMIRIRRLSPLLSQHKVKFRRGRRGNALCLQQLRDFPNGDHDDGPDAMEMACRTAASMMETGPSDDGETIGDIDYGN